MERRKINVCNKCGWLWASRKLISYQCPNCKTTHWNDEKETKNKEGVVDE
jgi:predicted RNA-binding Zn-ribbon protein involved in translation (DUF1610 family)